MDCPSKVDVVVVNELSKIFKNEANAIKIRIFNKLI